MQRLLPVTWTDTSCSAIFSSTTRQNMIALHLERPLLQGVLSMEDFEI